MNAHIIYDLTVVHLFKCIFNFGPSDVYMLQVPRHLNPATVNYTSFNPATVDYWNLITRQLITQTIKHPDI